jgi:hypothetical protein
VRSGSFDGIGLLGAVAFAAFGIWVLQPGASGTVQGQVAALAARMQGRTPQPMADGSTLRAVTANGTTVVLAIDGRVPWQPATSDDEAAAAIAADLCAGTEIRDLIGRGAQVRIEGRTAEGEQLPALAVTRCDAG